MLDDFGFARVGWAQAAGRTSEAEVAPAGFVEDSGDAAGVASSSAVTVFDGGKEADIGWGEGGFEEGFGAKVEVF
jgi:hypothetical protein